MVNDSESVNVDVIWACRWRWFRRAIFRTASNEVSVTRDEIERRMPDKDVPDKPVTGRNGGTFRQFGNYSVNLFQNIELLARRERRLSSISWPSPSLRSLTQSTATTIPAPQLDGDADGASGQQKYHCDLGPF